MNKKDEVFLTIANELGKLSTCDRASIGAVVTHNGRCICWGYNGAPPSLPHCSENDHGWRGAPCNIEGLEREAVEIKIVRYGCRNAIHAEANAISFAARQGISTDHGTLYVSQSPCLDCSRLVIAAGIERVVFSTMYRDRSGVGLLKQAGVIVDGV